MKNKHQKCVLLPPSNTKTISLAISSHKYKKRFNLHFNSFFAHNYEGECRDHFEWMEIALIFNTSGLSKYRPDIDMSDNYFLLSRFLSPC